MPSICCDYANAVEVNSYTFFEFIYLLAVLWCCWVLVQRFFVLPRNNMTVRWACQRPIGLALWRKKISLRSVRLSINGSSARQACALLNLLDRICKQIHIEKSWIDDIKMIGPVQNNVFTEVTSV